jgi:DOPA 4,5-dioxygenase
MHDIRGYHIHIYFNKQTKSEETATVVWDKAKTDWGEKNVGRFHRDPVGPHTTGSFLIWVDSEKRDYALEWTTNNRQGLKAMMHKVTDDDFHDHTEAVTWYGDGGPHILDTSIFKPK